MTLNRNHSPNGGILINNGESVLRECKNVELSFSDVTGRGELLRGTRKGTTYLTPYRMVFVSHNAKDSLVSVMFPYYLMKGCSIEQPVFGANFIKGTISAEPGGGWEGHAAFKLNFPSGGAIEFGQQLFKLASSASRAPPVPSGGASFGYPSPGGMNNYVPAVPVPAPAPAPPPAPYNYPQNYPYVQPPPSNGYYPGAPQPPAAMGYPCPPASAGVYPSVPAVPSAPPAPSAPPYMPPPPPYPGPPQGWPAPYPGSVPADAAGNAFYIPNNPHNAYMPMEQPPPYAPYAPYQDKKNN
ncbi:WW domain-binding protein 2-like [Paramormyrops kingsleyae]|uniref:WW domain-binding protein 2-like n=1 Tax=Paramormyrops kingsleyae TaxID=1676925 RepID=UPI003B96FDC1